MRKGKYKLQSCLAVPLLITVLLFPALASAGGKTAPSSYGGVDHTRKFSVYNGPSTCLGCHTTSKMGSNLATDVYNSAHFQFRTFSTFIDMPGGGAHGMVDRACGLPGSTMMANNYAYIAVGPTGYTQEDGCGKCHIAYKIPIMYPTADSAIPDIDCLRCHAEYYGAEWDNAVVIATYGANTEAHVRKVVPLPDNSGLTWSQDRSLKTAGSVGNLPKTKYCLRCHEHGYTGYKRATPFEPEYDAHAKAAVNCSQCHQMQQHKIARGNFVTDMVANDLPNVDLSCASATCHGTVPHTLTNAADLNKHTTNVRCEACHMPVLPADNNIAARAWAPFTMNPVTGAWDITPATTTGTQYPGLWDAYVELYDHRDTTFKYSQILDNVPAIRWFDGKASMLAQPSGAYGARKSVGGCSMLFALKPFISGMLFDGGWLANAKDNVTGTRMYSMKWFYEKNWKIFQSMNFNDPQYADAAAYWAARPDMAAMLDNFPMMLMFDRKIYLSEAGTVVGTPIPGPQTGATYPGIKKAIDSGMAAMGAAWSGESFFGMWVPPNMVDPADPGKGADPRFPVGSFITPSHAIKGGAEMGEPCYTCHMTDDEYAGRVPVGPKRVDFGYLGYPDKDGNGRVDPKHGDIEAPVVTPGLGNIAMTFTSTRKNQTLTTVVTAVNSTTQAVLPNVTVTGSLTVPGTTTPVAFSGTTGNAGTVSFPYTKTSLPTGTYVFKVTQLTYNGTAYPQNCSKSIVK